VFCVYDEAEKWSDIKRLDRPTPTLHPNRDGGEQSSAKFRPGSLFKEVVGQ
jgi:hypothetical protein